MSLSKLEKLLKLTSPFSDEYYKGVIGIICIEKYVIKDLENHLNQFNITFQQFNLMRILKGQYPNPINLYNLKDRMLHQNSDISRMVERLVKLQYVFKVENTENKRKLNIQLTESGLALIHKIDLHHEKFKSIMPKINQEEIKLFNQLIDKLLA